MTSETTRDHKDLFDIDATLCCKGVALLLLLWHHLFYQTLRFGEFVHATAVISKVCVATFLILSGYGLSKSTERREYPWVTFYFRRLGALYSRYWLVATIFIPIGVFWMNRPLESQFFGHPYIKLSIQLLGIHRFVYPEYGYNATWWYLSVIIPLTLLFPVLAWITRKAGIVFITCLFLIHCSKREIIPVLHPWILPFVLGIYFAQKNALSMTSVYIQTLGRWRLLLLPIAVVALAVVRDHNLVMTGVRFDWLFSVVIILTVFEFSQAFSILKRALRYLGTHLFNVFLFHTFMYQYYWHDIIYSPNSPFAIFGLLLVVCVIISLEIDFVIAIMRAVIQRFAHWAQPRFSGQIEQTPNATPKATS